MLTNDPYDTHLEYIKQQEIQKPNVTDKVIPPNKRRSEVRFKIAADRVSEYQNRGEAGREVNEAWNIMEQVRLNGFASDALMEPTQWNIVYDLTENKVFFRTRSQGAIKEIDLAQIDFTSGAQEMMLDMNIETAGLVNSKFEPWSKQKNDELIWKNRFLIGKVKSKAAMQHDLPIKSCKESLQHTK